MRPNSTSVWNTDQYDNRWYAYQNREMSSNRISTITADKAIPEHKFRDFDFTTRAIETITKLHQDNITSPFFVAVGFKLPHVAIDVPYKYYKLYEQQAKEREWVPPGKAYRTFPLNAPAIAHNPPLTSAYLPRTRNTLSRSSSRKHVGHANNTATGLKLTKKIGQVFPKVAYREIKHGYAAAVTFLDAMLGRILDTMDALNLWENTLLVLTSDHGMHNGEQGMW
jgi:iduronate 2-sulfatase